MGCPPSRPTKRRRCRRIRDLNQGASCSTSTRSGSGRNDFKKEHAKAAQLKEQQSFVARNAEGLGGGHGREPREAVVETEQLSRPSRGLRWTIRPGGDNEAAAAPDSGAGRPEAADGADIGIWDMVVTSDDGSFDVRANLDDEAASTVKLEAGTALKVLDEQVDGSGVLWVKTDTPGGWVRRRRRMQRSSTAW